MNKEYEIEIDELDQDDERYDEDPDIKECAICGKLYTEENVEPFCTECMKIKYMGKIGGGLFGRGWK